MLLALVACWRPDPYVPPEPLPAADIVPTDEAAGEAAEPQLDAEAIEPEEAPPANAEEEEDPQGPAFTAYRARTVQAPVTLVDDFGKTLAVLPTPAVELEVRDEDDIRARVWCATCTPAVEGWIQIHLIQRAD
jgi:hypothetical protein